MNVLAQFDDAVFIQNQQVKTTSLKVAELFDKRHDHVLRKIESLECSPEFTSTHFWGHVQTVGIGNGASRESKYYEMTKDGFIFLVMGFTGEAAAKIKEAYINTFNQMAIMLHNQQFVPQGIGFGTKVQLITGSPDFTVNRVIHDAEGYIREVEVVCWNKNKLHKEILNISSVKPVFNVQNHALEEFWNELSRFGIYKLNHSNNKGLIALNLKQVMQAIDSLHDKHELIDLLTNSRAPYPEFLKYGQVWSRLDTKNVKCWVFKLNDQSLLLGQGE